MSLSSPSPPGILSGTPFSTYSLLLTLGITILPNCFSFSPTSNYFFLGTMLSIIGRHGISTRHSPHPYPQSTSQTHEAKLCIMLFCTLWDPLWMNWSWYIWETPDILDLAADASLLFFLFSKFLSRSRAYADVVSLFLIGRWSLTRSFTGTQELSNLDSPASIQQPSLRYSSQRSQFHSHDPRDKALIFEYRITVKGFITAQNVQPWVIFIGTDIGNCSYEFILILSLYTVAFPIGFAHIQEKGHLTLRIPTSVIIDFLEITLKDLYSFR